MELPRPLVDAWRHEWRWLDALPQLVAECAQQWSLEVEAPIENRWAEDVPRRYAHGGAPFDRERARGWGVAHNLAWAWDERRGWLDQHVEEARRILNAR